MAIKKSQTTSKSSAKKNITSNKIKKAKKPESKKVVKTPGTKLSKPKTAAKPAVPKSGPEIKKPVKIIEVRKTKKGNIAATKPDKTSVATAKGGKALSKEPLKPISVGKSETPGKKPLKKSPEKIVTVKTRTAQEKNVKPVNTKKTSTQKAGKVVSGKTEGKAAKEIKAPVKTVSAAIKERPSTAKKAEPEVTTQKTFKPASTIKPSAQKAGKGVSGKTEGKAAKEIKAPVKTVSAAIEEKQRTAKTVKTGIQKKSALRSTISEIKKPVKQKPVVKTKEKTEAPLSTMRKMVQEKGSISARPLPAISKKTSATYTTHPQAKPKPKKTAKLKVFLPEEELPPEETLQVPLRQLPEEYGENELLLMEVDPSIVFVSWEIKPDNISGEAGSLVLRVYDVTSINFDGTNASRFFDISLRNRADSKFFDIKMQGRDVIMEIGLLHPDGTFKAIKQSARVLMPELQLFDELDIARPATNPETLIGY